MVSSTFYANLLLEQITKAQKGTDELTEFYSFGIFSRKSYSKNVSEINTRVFSTQFSRLVYLIFFSCIPCCNRRPEGNWTEADQDEGGKEVSRRGICYHNGILRVWSARFVSFPVETFLCSVGHQHGPDPQPGQTAHGRKQTGQEEKTKMESSFVFVFCF